MLMCEYDFEPRNADALEELADQVVCFLGSLERNGQTWGTEVIGHVDGAVRAVLTVPRADALSDQHKSERVRRAEKGVSALCARPPAWRVVDDRAAVPGSERWRDSATFYLFTHMFDATSPLCAGSDGQPVPLYLVDVDLDVREALVRWARDYRQLDELQLGCGPLEIPAYREVATPDSGCAIAGRELCQTIEHATGKATYYYLLRHWGRELGETTRLCPGCGAAWAQRAGEESRGLAWFDFRCDPCRLVSHLAVSFESPELARIGEWPAG